MRKKNQSGKISVIIRCYNEQHHISKLLDGILKQTAKNVEIVLVDSGSTDATLSIASNYPVKILSIKPEEFSFGRSLNIGCEAAQGEFIVIASAHVHPVNNIWLERLLAPFSDPKVALVYGRQRGDEINRYSEHRIFAIIFPEYSNLHQNKPFCNNANAAIRKKIWEQIPYDESLTGLEDTDWAKRAMGLGYYIAYAADAEIIHIHNETPRGIYNRYRREAIAMKHIFPQKRFYFYNFLWSLVANVIADYFHACRDKVLWQNILDILMYRVMQFWGGYQGFREKELFLNNYLRRVFYYANRIKRSRTAI
jgi:glycosyltransferase involved in cell wall biosynthesis